MKTSIKTLCATGLIALALSTSTVYANPIVTSETVASNAINISTIKRLIVSGNVEVTIVQSPKSRVLYTAEDYNSSVKKVGSSLYITSKSKTQAAKVTVYVDDIYRIETADNAIVQTKDTLNLKYLQVFMKDNSKVDLNAKTESLYTTISNTAELNLTGVTSLYTIAMDRSSKITLDQFRAEKTAMISSDIYVTSRR